MLARAGLERTGIVEASNEDSEVVDEQWVRKQREQISGIILRFIQLVRYRIFSSLHSELRLRSAKVF